MPSLKFKLFVAFLIIGTGCYVAYLEVQASDDSDQQISEAAVWPTSDQQLAQINQDCRKDRALDSSQCFIARMPDLGASEEAVSFTRDYAEQYRGTLAILRGFHAMDAVDLGYVYYPQGAGMRQGWVLLNGFPSLINVDDLDRLPEAEMQRHPLWAELHKQFPQLQISPDDAQRELNAVPQVERLPDGAQRFLVEYALRDGCRFCTLAGHATFSFDFDASGTLVEVRLVGIAPQNGS